MHLQLVNFCHHRNLLLKSHIPVLAKISDTAYTLIIDKHVIFSSNYISVLHLCTYMCIVTVVSLAVLLYNHAYM